MKRSTMYKLLTCVFLFVLLFSFASPAATAPEGGKERVYVVFQPGAKGAVEQSLNAAGAEFHYSFDDLDAFVVSLPTAALEGIRRNPNVAYVEEDVLRFPIGVMKSETQAAQVVPYGIDMVQARDVWDVNRDEAIDPGAPTGAGRKICIIDSGFYQPHEDFQGINVSGYNGNLPWNQDGDGHGSHVAGTIAAMNNALGVVGVTPGTVQLYIVRVFGDDGAWAYSSSLVDAASRCASGGANIISMSLGGTFSSRTERVAFDNHYANGILPIAAAGNDGNTRTSYPAGYASVVSVAAIDANKVVADFSQQNSDVEISAPGVGVLSTVPYLDSTTVTVNGVTYTGGHIENSARGNASGVLLNGGLCDATGAWSGKVVLCERGVISFYDKVRNVQNSGGAAAVVYNNVPGGFLGTLGDGNSSTIVAVSLSQEDGQFLVANRLGQSATVSSTLTKPASGYEYYDGTSMATPHISAVAALVWSANTSWTNQQIRDALNFSAEDLGAAGRDVAYGYGLVQAKAALTYLGYTGGGTTNSPPAASFSYTTNGLTVTFTDTSTDSDGTIASRSWNFGDGGTSTSQNPSHTYAVSGTYTVSLTVTDDDGATGTTNQSVTVSSGTTAKLVVGVSTDKETYANRQTVYIYNFVTDGTNPVSGATVSITVKRDATGVTIASGSCTTGTDGKCTASYKVDTRKQGTGSFTVTSVASKSGFTTSEPATASYTVQ